MTTTNKWEYRHKTITCLDDVDPCCSFIVYKIYFPSDRTYYYGSKQLFSVRKVKLSKKRSKELYKGRGSYPKFEYKKTESDWLTYKSSSPKVQKRLETEEARFNIVDFFPTKQHMLMYETYLIVEAFIQFDEYILNEWVNFKGPKIKRTES